MLERMTIPDPYGLQADYIHKLFGEPSHEWLCGLVRIFESSDLIKRVGDKSINARLIFLSGRHHPSVKMFALLLAPRDSFTMIALAHAKEIITKYTLEELDKIIYYLKNNNPLHSTLAHLIDFIIDEDFDNGSDKISKILRGLL